MIFVFIATALSRPEALIAKEAPNQNVKAEERLKKLKIDLPAEPTPFGGYVEAVRSGNLLFLSGTLPIVGREPKFVGRVGDNLSVEEGRNAARVAALNALSIAKNYLGSLDKVRRVVRLGVFLVTTPDFKEHPKVADGASELLENIFGKERVSARTVLGMASLPLGVPVELEVTLEVEDGVSASTKQGGPQ
jgi:enamine deaminase RidA (YjgF/YER057c/UK114 family)